MCVQPARLVLRLQGPTRVLVAMYPIVSTVLVLTFARLVLILHQELLKYLHPLEVLVSYAIRLSPTWPIVSHVMLRVLLVDSVKMATNFTSQQVEAESVFSATFQTVKHVASADQPLSVRSVLLATVKMEEIVFNVFSHVPLAIPTPLRIIVPPAKHPCISHLLFPMPLALPTPFQTVSVTILPTSLNARAARLFSHSIQQQTYVNLTVPQTA